jgi:hypothetical protein
MSLSAEKYDYGNTDINIKQRDLYLNMNYHHFFDKLSLKSGISYDSRKQDLKGSFAVYDYAVGEQYPNLDYSDTREINLPEAFAYGKYNFNEHWITGVGIRKNIPLNNRESYLSGQWNVNYSFFTNHSINASIGRYHSYALPNAELEEVTLYQSDQVSVDYKFEHDNIELTTALFMKNTEYGNTTDNVNGAEIFTKVYLLKNKLNLQGSYTLINAKREKDNMTYPTKYDLNYFIRGSLKYQHSNNLDISLIMLYREGTYYQPVVNAEYHNELNLYAPQYASKENMQRLGDYLKLDLSISKLWSLTSDIGLVTFFNVSNLLNTNNVREKTYNFNYSESENLLYSKRTVYFGGVIYF